MSCKKPHPLSILQQKTSIHRQPRSSQSESDNIPARKVIGDACGRCIAARLRIIARPTLAPYILAQLLKPHETDSIRASAKRVSGRHSSRCFTAYLPLPLPSSPGVIIDFSCARSPPSIWLKLRFARTTRFCTRESVLGAQSHPHPPAQL